MFTHFQTINCTKDNFELSIIPNDIYTGLVKSIGDTPLSLTVLQRKTQTQEMFIRRKTYFFLYGATLLPVRLLKNRKRKLPLSDFSF